MPEPFPVDPQFWEIFSRHVAHQMSNPLAAIEASAYLLEELNADSRKQPVKPAELSPFIQSINEEVTQLKELVAEFRQYFSAMSILPTEVDLVEFFRARTAEAETEGLRIEILEPAKVLGRRLRVDAGLMQKAFHLLWRGLSDLGVSQLKLELKSSPDLSVVELIAVNPIEIAEVEQVGELFVVKPNRDGIGLGLGLPLAKRIIELHGGTIAPIPEPEGGLRVEIRLPQ